VQVYQQSKEVCNTFLSKLRQSYELIGPVMDELVKFRAIQNPQEIYLQENSYFPVKEFFFKKQEVLFQFDGNKITVPAMQSPKRVFFGIRKCDLNAIKHQDMVFMDQGKDPYYAASRKNSYLIGYHCPTAPSPYCFCGSMNLADYFDLMYYDRGSHYLVEVGSAKGNLLLAEFSSFFTETQQVITPEQKIIPGADRLEKKNISKLYDHPDWKKGVDICLSCAACTTLCPTCYCFSIHDEVSAKDLHKGERQRTWSSCQLQEFTKVAGDHVFRKNRDERFKHRIYHQLEYFKEKYGVPLCVGCGRCISGCPTRIDFVEIINKMKT